MMSKYWAIFKTQLLNRLAYPADLFGHGFTIVIFLWVFIFLWRTTYRTMGATEGSIAGLTLSQTIWYLMLAETLMLSKPRLSRLISAAVKDGSIAYMLNKPYNFLLYHFTVGLGDSLTNMIFNLVAGGALVWLMQGPPPPAWGWPLVLFTMILAWLIDYCFAALIGLLAFVTEEVSAFDWIYQKLLFILGGMLIPLDFLPDWLRSISLATPFAYTTYGPARFFVEPSLERFAGLFLGQMIWLAVLGSSVAIFYRRSTQSLAINGG
jgi:ABC-2 type transport system permease protein